MNDILIDYIKHQILVGKEDYDLTSEDDLLGGGLVDSMGIIKLIAFIENKFELKVPPNDMIIENFMSVSAIENYLERRKAG